MSSLLSRLTDLATAIGADVKSLSASQASLQRSAYPFPVPAGWIGESFPRFTPSVTGQATVSGQPRAALVKFYAGEVVNALGTLVGSTAAGAASHQWMQLWDTSGKVLSSSADQSSGAWAALSIRSFSLLSPFTIPTTGFYYVAQCATTSVSLVSATSNGTAAGLLPYPVVTAPSGFTTPPAVGSLVGTLSTNTVMNYNVWA